MHVFGIDTLDDAIHVSFSLEQSQLISLPLVASPRKDRLLGRSTNWPGHLRKMKSISMRKSRVTSHVVSSSWCRSTPESLLPNRSTNIRGRATKRPTRNVCLSRLYFALNWIQGSLQIDKKKKEGNKHFGMFEKSKRYVIQNKKKKKKENKMKRKHSGIESRKRTTSRWMESRDSSTRATIMCYVVFFFFLNFLISRQASPIYRPIAP